MKKGYEFRGYKLGEQVIHRGQKREIIAFHTTDSICFIGLGDENYWSIKQKGLSSSGLKVLDGMENAGLKWVRDEEVEKIIGF